MFYLCVCFECYCWNGVMNETQISNWHRLGMTMAAHITIREKWETGNSSQNCERFMMRDSFAGVVGDATESPLCLRSATGQVG